MNDERMGPLLEVWLRDRQIPPPKAQTAVAKVMANVPRTRQQGRWWPLPAFRRKVQSPTASDATDFQPSHVPATNGHTPTVIGRTHSMPSPAKAITAGALVFAIGGLLLIAQPFQQSDGPPGAATQELAATSFTGNVTVLDWSDGERAEAPDGLEASTGTVARVRFEASDPRLTGEVTITGSHLADPDAAGYAMLSAQTYELTNDEGSWVGEGTGLASSELGVATDTFILVGKDGYEGLTAYVISEDPDLRGNTTIRGLIFPSAMPEVPQPRTTE